MKKLPIILLGSGVVLILGLLVFLLWPKPVVNTPQVTTMEGITVTAPLAGQVITSPLIVSGSVSGQGWTGFEGQVGTVRLLDNSGKELGLGILTATGDWTVLPTHFETMIYFDYPGDGAGQLVFRNENPSGQVERDKTFSLPVRLTKSSGDKTKVKLYFRNNKLETGTDCDVKFYAEREIPKTQAIARAALEELLKGPTSIEQQAQFSTSINPGVKIQSLTITDGVAKVDFSQELQKGVAGSCKVSTIRSQIIQTLTQFPTVKSVIISINGRTDDILQP